MIPDFKLAFLRALYPGADKVIAEAPERVRGIRPLSIVIDEIKDWDVPQD